jgi:hypothetical protein
MRARRVERTALTAFFVAACVMLFIAAYAAIAHAQNPLSSLIVPQQSEVPVSPTTPGTLPGTQAGAGTTVSTNPVTVHRRWRVGAQRRLGWRPDNLGSAGRARPANGGLAA